MNREAINKWLDEEYGCSYTRLEELHDFYFEKYCDLKQENKQLKDNWNIINQEILKIRQSTFSKYNSNEWENCLSFNDDIKPILDKMQELEQGKCYENRINNLENDLGKYEKENKWLKDIINSILHI
jgi:chromosome segregation ATPase|nr:MAG TPA_asm: hypothetical protein [Caudoviricetes sp.]